MSFGSFDSFVFLCFWYFWFMVFVYLPFDPFDSSQIPRDSLTQWPKDDNSAWVLAQVRKAAETGHYIHYGHFFIFLNFLKKLKRLKDLKRFNGLHVFYFLFFPGGSVGLWDITPFISSWISWYLAKNSIVYIVSIFFNFLEIWNFENFKYCMIYMIL